MLLQAIFFYLFAAVSVASAVMVISARNPVHSVLFLILSFFSAAGLFVMLGAEFLAMILVVVYVGAVAVLFLFVVMMLDINFVETAPRAFSSICRWAALIGSLILLVELLFIVASSGLVDHHAGGRRPVAVRCPWPRHRRGAATLQALGASCSTPSYFYLFQGGGSGAAGGHDRRHLY